MALSGIISSTYRGWTYLIEWSAEQSVVNNYSLVTCVHKLICDDEYGLYIGGRSNSCTADGEKKTFTSPDISTAGGTTHTLGTTTHTVKHNDDGTKSCTISGVFYVQATLSGTWKESISASGNITLDTIPRASSLTAANGTLDTEQTLTINRAADSFKHRLTYKCGDVSGYIAGSANSYTTATSIKWTPPIGLAHENTIGTSVSITLTLYTYTNDGTHVGTTSVVITCAIPTSVKPSVTIAWKDVSDAEGTYGSPVQGFSRLEITLTEQTSYSSPIASRSITANGAKYTASPVTTEVLTAAGSNQIAATVKDQRGRSGSAAVTLDVLAYTAPVVSKLTVHRCDEDGTENDQGDYIRAQFSAAITALNNKNSAVYKLRYKTSTAADYTEINLTDLAGTYVVTNYSYIFEADGSNSYDVEVVATDNHGTATRATSASTAFTLLNWHPDGTGMGVGKVSEKANTLEVGLDAELQGPVSGRVYGLSTLPAIPEGADVNTYVTPGIWAVRNNSVATSLSNLPVTSAGRFIVSAALGLEENGKWRYVEQRFIPHNRGLGTTRAWIQYVTSAGTDELIYSGWIAEALAAYPVGSIYLAYNHTSPAELFGGTWERISNYILRGVAEGGTIGETGTLADGSGRTYINIAIWRRTA